MIFASKFKFFFYQNLDFVLGFHDDQTVTFECTTSTCPWANVGVTYAAALTGFHVQDVLGNVGVEVDIDTPTVTVADTVGPTLGTTWNLPPMRSTPTSWLYPVRFLPNAVFTHSFSADIAVTTTQGRLVKINDPDAVILVTFSVDGSTLEFAFTDNTNDPSFDSEYVLQFCSNDVNDPCSDGDWKNLHSDFSDGTENGHHLVMDIASNRVAHIANAYRLSWHTEYQYVRAVE